MCTASLLIDIKKKIVYLDGEELHLPPIPYQIMEYLLTNPGVPLSELKVKSEVHRVPYVLEDHLLKWHIGRVRKKLGEHRSLIRTRRGFGYDLSTDYCEV